MINLKQNGSGQNINLSPIYNQIEVLDENTVLLSRRIDTIQTGSVDLSDIENSISILNNNLSTVQTDLNSVKIDVNNLNSEIDSIKTNLTSVVSDVSVLSSNLNNLSTNQVNYYDYRDKITQRGFNYNLTGGFFNETTGTISASIYGVVPVSSYKIPFVDIKAYECYNCTFETGYRGYSNLNITTFSKNLVKGENLYMNGIMNNISNTYKIAFFNGSYPTFSLNLFSDCKNLEFHDHYFDKNTISSNLKINNNDFICFDNSYQSISFANFNDYSIEKNNFDSVVCLNCLNKEFKNNTFTTCDYINCNCYNVETNSLKNVRYLNYIGKNFGDNTYMNQSDYPYQCQLMNAMNTNNKFVYPDLLNITCKMFATNTISNANFVDMKCVHLISNEFYNVNILKIHNANTGDGFYSAIGDFYLENFSTKSTNESISNVIKFRFNNGSSNLYDTNLNWTLTNTNYNFVESNVVQCGDFNPIPYIRSINKHLESIETKLTQSTSPESDVFVKKINIPNNINGTTFTSAQSLKINCISVGNFKCSDIKSLKINGSNLESGMFSNVKSVEINAVNCDELTFDNVEYIKVSCTNTPNIYCSNVGTIKLNNYDKIQLQKFNLFEAPHPNNYFYSCYMCNWNVNAPESNAYDAHFMTDYTYNSKSYATVKFKFNVDTFEQPCLYTTTQFNSTITAEGLTTNRLLFWKDNTFKLGNAVEYVQNNGLLETAGNVLMNYQIQFDMPYVTTFSNYQR